MLTIEKAIVSMANNGKNAVVLCFPSLNHASSVGGLFSVAYEIVKELEQLGYTVYPTREKWTINW